MGVIVAGDALFGSPVPDVLNILAAARKQRGIRIREHLGVRVCGDERQAVLGALPGHHLERVIGGTTEVRVIVLNGVVLRIGLNGRADLSAVVSVLERRIRQTGDSITGQYRAVDWVCQISRQIIGENIAQAHILCLRLIRQSPKITVQKPRALRTQIIGLDHNVMRQHVLEPNTPVLSIGLGSTVPRQKVNGVPVGQGRVPIGKRAVIRRDSNRRRLPVKHILYRDSGSHG